MRLGWCICFTPILILVKGEDEYSPSLETDGISIPLAELRLEIPPDSRSPNV